MLFTVGPLAFVGGSRPTAVVMAFAVHVSSIEIAFVAIARRKIKAPLAVLQTVVEVACVGEAS